MAWSLFGLGQDEYVKLTPFENDFTETLGKMLYLCYHICLIIVLLNVLIASMTQTYEKILVSNNLEMKFYNESVARWSLE